MERPPENIDGAKVWYYVISDHVSFGYINSFDGSSSIAIHKVCICQYQGDEKYCVFFCSKNWKVFQDIETDTLECALYFSSR